MLNRGALILLAFFLIGVIIWSYGVRVDDPTLRLVGIAFFGVSVVLRFFRRSDTRPRSDDEIEPTDVA